MSIVETYKSEFSIVCFDEDLNRSEKLQSLMNQKGYNFTAFNSRGLFMESFENNLPHVVMLYYQPLSMKFREIMTKIKSASQEIEVVLLGANDFWPGIHSLIQRGLADDFWTWPQPGSEAIELRINRLIEKNIFKFIAEQRSEETQKIVERLEGENKVEEFTEAALVDSTDVSQLLGATYQSEASMIEDLVGQLKRQYPESEFVYFKNYKARNQLLVTRTSFAAENYFRGQSVPFSHERLNMDRGETLAQVRTLIEESFACEDFLMQPVEFADQFFGMIMAVNFKATPFLQKTARYLSISLRNFMLENSEKTIDIDNDFEIGVKKSQFALNLSTEISRARRLKMPVSMIVSQIEYVGDDQADFDKAFDIVKNNLRGYDFVTRLEDNQIAIVLPHCRYEDAAIKAETIRRQLVARGLKTQNTPLRLCFGVSEYPSLSADSDAMIEDAKRACNQVLASGKNKVCLYTTEEDFVPEFRPNL